MKIMWKIVLNLSSAIHIFDCALRLQTITKPKIIFKIKQQQKKTPLFELYRRIEQNKKHTHIYIDNYISSDRYKKPISIYLFDMVVEMMGLNVDHPSIKTSHHNYAHSSILNAH